MEKGRTVHLLIVEDNPAYLYLIERAFSNARGESRWSIAVATDGHQALGILFDEDQNAARLPDLVLLDWHLPKINGNEVLRKMKESATLRKIPVLVFSSSQADSDILSAYDGHANGYITKPGSMDALNAIVDSIERFWITAAYLPKVRR